MRTAVRRAIGLIAVGGASVALIAADAGTRVETGIVSSSAVPSVMTGGGAVDADGMRVAAIELRSAGVMHFTANGTLFLADPVAAAVYAIDVAEAHRDTSSLGVRIDDVDRKIAAALGTTRDDIRIHDMVAHPLSQSLYFSVTRGRGASAVPLVVSVTKVEETVTVLPLENIRHARVLLADAPAPGATTQRGDSLRPRSITDLALVDNELLVAGLSNEEFSSTLRRIPYPFGKEGVSTTVEIFHTSHNQFETASPIETFLPLTLNGKPSLIAGYGCAPIAAFNRADLTKRHLRGSTIAELGGGNRPLDMIRYTATNGKERVLIANSHRTLMRMDVEEIAKAPGLTKSTSQAYEAMGVPYLSVSSFGVLQLDNYNRANAVSLQRGAQDGGLHVVSHSYRFIN